MTNKNALDLPLLPEIINAEIPKNKKDESKNITEKIPSSDE